MRSVWTLSVFQTHASKQKCILPQVGGVSAGLSTILEELGAGAARVEALLALGASRREATAAAVQRALAAALAPALAHMSAVGVVRPMP